MEEKLRALGAPIFKDEYFPTLLVCFGKAEEIARSVEYLSRDTYEYVLQKRLDVFYKDVTRPELPWHRFGPVKQFDRTTSAIYILARREKKPLEKTPPADYESTPEAGGS
jgi:hypothetical protein